jgi:hypothetical protein
MMNGKLPGLRWNISVSLETVLAADALPNMISIKNINNNNHIEYY